MLLMLKEYADFLEALTGVPVSPVILERFDEKSWSKEEIERLHLLYICASHAKPS